MRIWPGRHRPPLGVDLGADALKVVEISSGGQVLQLASLPTPAGALQNDLPLNPGLLVMALNRLVEEKGWRGREAVTALPGGKVITRFLHLPLMPEKEMAEAVKWEAEKYLPVNNQDLVLDFLRVGEVEAEGQRQALVLLAGAPGDLSRRFFQIFQEAGLLLTAIDIIPLALQRWLNWQLRSPLGVTAILDLGAGSSSLVILENGQVTFTRVLNVEGAALRAELEEEERLQEIVLLPGADAAAGMEEGNAFFPGELVIAGDNPEGGGGMGISAPRALEELLREMRRSLDFYRTQAPGKTPAGFWLTGSLADQKGLAERLGKELELPVSTGTVAGSEFTLPPSHAVAMGLALRGFSGKKF